MEGAEEGEEEDTLAGVSAYALRTFLRQTRELAYQVLGLLATFVPALWEAHQVSSCLEPRTWCWGCWSDGRVRRIWL